MFAIISRMTAETRVAIYRHLIDTGRAPTAAETAAQLGRDPTEVERAYTELAESRVITFGPSTRTIWMAHPFSATPTPYRVESGGISYWANCAWDALGIAAMLGRDTRCTCRCPDCAEPLDLSVSGGAVAGDAVIHFVVPARRFWENVAYT
jgi:hypothetical protein